MGSMTSCIEIAPSILAANFASLAADITAVEQAGATMLHVDVMDGHFVPNISIGVPVVASLRKATRLTLDVHLMIERPECLVDAFADAGADWISVHQEATAHLDRVLGQIKSNGCRGGAVVNPATPVDVLADVLHQVDFVLVMSVNPGFGGQKFIPHALRKLEQLRDLRARLGLKYQIEVDGGIGLENAAAVARAGAEILVAGTSVFHAQDIGGTFRQLKQNAQEAIVQEV
jgi:ribulose-phosphate 3-epimerase